MPFPNFSYCIICETIRPEMGGKLSILGFYGIAPSVEVVVVNPTLPVNLCFVASFPAFQDVTPPYAGIALVLKPNGTAAFESPPIPMQVIAGRPGLFGVGAVITPPYTTGLHRIRFLVNNTVKLETHFNLRFPTQAEIAAMGFPPGAVPVLGGVH